MPAKPALPSPLALPSANVEANKLSSSSVIMMTTTQVGPKWF
jgi:hypothetical protein